jgi:hypothetical protein
MQQTTDRTGQAFWLLEWPCPMISPLVPYFGVENVRLTNVLESSRSLLDWGMLIGVLLTHSFTLHIRNGCESAAGFVYSPGQRRKKKGQPHHISFSQ